MSLDKTLCFQCFPELTARLVLATLHASKLSAEGEEATPTMSGDGRERCRKMSPLAVQLYNVAL